MNRTSDGWLVLVQRGFISVLHEDGLYIIHLGKVLHQDAIGLLGQQTGNVKHRPTVLRFGLNLFKRQEQLKRRLGTAKVIVKDAVDKMRHLQVQRGDTADKSGEDDLPVVGGSLLKWVKGESLEWSLELLHISHNTLNPGGVREDRLEL